jgi:cysteine desulfurase/selenocysteine lyase
MFSKREFDTFPELDITYLDSACVTLRPQCVINKIQEYYLKYPVCHGRSNHHLAVRLEKELKNARKLVQKFINAKSEKEIIFTRNATEGINLVANTLQFNPGDVILTSDKEHNSNLVPWLKKTQGNVEHEVIPTNDDNTWNMDAFEEKLKQLKEEGKKIKLISVVYTSNIDGVTNPIKQITTLAHSFGALVLVDGAQAIAHQPVDVKKLDVDFFVASGHKMYGPSGIGFLYGKQKELEKMDQFLVGGETVEASTYTSYTPKGLPEKFEAGLQDYAGIIGLGEAVEFIKAKGFKSIQKQELELNSHITKELKLYFDSEDMVLIGPQDPKLRGAICNVIVKNAHEFSLLLDNTYNIAVRSGQHCVHSWFAEHKKAISVRISFGCHNTLEDAKKVINAIKEIMEMR